MHVVIVSDYAEVNGGAARVSIVSARALAERGVKVTYFCGSGSVSDELVHPLISVRHLGLADVWNRPGRVRAAASAIWNDPARRALQSLLEETGPDTLVHVHQWTRCLSPSIFAALDRVPWAVSLHDYFYVCPTGLLYIAPRQEPCERRPMSASCLLCNCDTRSPLHKALRVTRQLATGAALSRNRSRSAFIHVSDFAKSVAQPHLPDGSAHFVVPNPGGAPVTTPVDVRNNRAFVYVGRLQREKGVLDLARASRDANVPVIFLGEGPEENRIRTANPAADIRPWGSSVAVEETMRQARSIVLPSRWNETFGLTVLEAQALGVPAIVARNSGAAEIIESSKGGFVIGGGDVDHLTEVLRRLAADDDLVEALGARAHAAYALGFWGAAAYGERLITCYRSILGRSETVC